MRHRLVAVVMLAVAACSSSGQPAGSPSPSPVPRIASTASVKIVEPAAGAEVVAGTVPVRIELTGGEITEEVSTNLVPGRGHLHLKLDGSIVSMNYATQAQIQVAPGEHLVEVEFVALDHGPFDPRVVTTVVFTAT